MAGKDRAATGRTVRISGDAVKALRKARAWTPERLATAAGCSVKTIKNFEQSKEAYISTLERVAKALAVEPSTLLYNRKEYIKDSIVATEATIPTAVEVLFQGRFQDLDETEQLARINQAIILRAGMRKIIVLAISDGSIKITLGMTDNDCLRLVKNYIKGMFDDMGLDTIRIPGLTALALPMSSNPETLPISLSFVASCAIMANTAQYKDRYNLFVNAVELLSEASTRTSVYMDDSYITIKRKFKNTRNLNDFKA